MKIESGPLTPRRAATTSLAVIAAIALLLSSCSSNKTTDSGAAPSSTAPAMNNVGAVKAGPSDSTPRKGGKITYGIDGEPEGLDPTRYAFTQAGHAVASAVFDSLATLDDNGNAVPYLATKFDPNSDYT